MLSFAASDGVRLMFAPGREYALLVNDGRPSSWRAALTVPAMTALMLGLLNAVGAAGRVPLSLVLSQIAAWSFVPLLQLIMASALIASAPSRPHPFPRSLELLFAAHAPWSLWLVAATLLETIYPDPYVLIGSGVIPFAITAHLLSVFCREVLGLTPAQARIRVAIHQTGVLLIVLTYIELATRLSVRILGALGA